MEALTCSEPVAETEPGADTAALRLLRGLGAKTLRIRDLGRPGRMVCPLCLRTWPAAEWQTKGCCPGCTWAHGYTQPAQATEPS